MATGTIGSLGKATLLTSGLSLLGGVGGVAYAMSKHKGFWLGTGLFFLGGFAGTALGYIISSTMNISDTVAADETANPSVGNV